MSKYDWQATYGKSGRHNHVGYNAEETVFDPFAAALERLVISQAQIEDYVRNVWAVTDKLESKSCLLDQILTNTCVNENTVHLLGSTFAEAIVTLGGPCQRGYFSYGALFSTYFRVFKTDLKTPSRGHRCLISSPSD